MSVRSKMRKNEKKKEKLKISDLSYFLGKNFFGDDAFQNIFVYQPTFSKLGLKEGKRTEYIIAWKSKGLFKSRLNHYIQISCLT